MFQVMDSVFRKYGIPISFLQGKNSTQVMGFFQPVRSKSWQSVVDVETPVGGAPRRQYVYIGPLPGEVEVGAAMKVGEKDYVLRRLERYYYGDTVAYAWGLCVEKGVSDKWES